MQTFLKSSENVCVCLIDSAATYEVDQNGQAAPTALNKRRNILRWLWVSCYGYNDIEACQFICSVILVLPVFSCQKKKTVCVSLCLHIATWLDARPQLPFYQDAFNSLL